MALKTAASAHFTATDLVAISLPPGPKFKDLVEAAWSARAAVLPIDHRLPAAETARILDAARPTLVIGDQAGVPARPPGGVGVDAEVAVVMTTSGTRGAPKLVEITHAGLRAAVDASARRLDGGATTPWISSLPLAHVGGMLVLARGLLTGARVTLRPRFEVADYAGRVVGHAAVVPTMLVRLLDSGVDLARVETWLVGGAAMPPALVARLQAAGAHIVHTYGLTESCGGVVYDGLPLDAVEVRLGEGNEICLSGPMLMRGYRFDPSGSAAALDGGWLHTGDVGSYQQGSLVVHGRRDDVINSGGEKVWPDEVEGHLRGLSGVVDAGVIGAPDPEWGQRVVACVVMAAGQEAPAVDCVRRTLEGGLATYKLPREVIPMTALPRTPSGKLRRGQLLEEARARLRTVL